MCINIEMNAYSFYLQNIVFFGFNIAGRISSLEFLITLLLQYSIIVVIYY